MRALLTGLVLAAVGIPALAQTTTPASAGQAPATASTATRRTTMSAFVTDATGAPLQGVKVKVTGPVPREGTTDAAGLVKFTALRAGDYRVRFEREGFSTLERDLTLKVQPGGTEIEVALTGGVPAPRTEAAPMPVVAKPAPPSRPPGDPKTLDVADFVERNIIGRNEPRKMSRLACTPSATTSLMQLREPLADRMHPDADEVLYIVGGEATLRIGSREEDLPLNALVSIPRGTTYSMTRRGRNPTILLSVLSGPVCEER